MRAAFRHIGMILLGAAAWPSAASAQLWGYSDGSEWSVAKLGCDAACKAELPGRLKSAKRAVSYNQTLGVSLANLPYSYNDYFVLIAKSGDYALLKKEVAAAHIWLKAKDKKISEAEETLKQTNMFNNPRTHLAYMFMEWDGFVERMTGDKAEAANQYLQAYRNGVANINFHFRVSDYPVMIRDIEATFQDSEAQIRAAEAQAHPAAFATYQSAQQKLAANDSEGALADINQSITQNPKFAPYFALRSAVQEKRDNLSQAYGDMLDANLVSNGPAFWIYHAKAHMLQTRVNPDGNVSSDLKTALDSMPWRKDLADALEAELLRVEARRHKPAYDRYIAGLEKIAAHDFSAALTELNQALSLDPEFGIAYTYRGLTIRQMLRQNISVPAGNRPLEDDLIDGWKKTQLPMAFEALADFQYDMGQNTSFARQREYWNASYEKSAKLVAYYPEDKDRAERFAQMRAGAVKQQYAVDDAAANQRARERAANPPADSGMPASNPRQDRLRAECAAIARENASHKNDIYWDGTTPPKCLFM